MRYPDKMQALVDYAAAVGAARLADGHGRVVSAGGHVPVEPHVIKVGAYTLCLYPEPGMLPRAVSKRIEGCSRLLHLLPGEPPRGGAGGSGPAHAEVRVWPPSMQAR